MVSVRFTVTILHNDIHSLLKVESVFQYFLSCSPALPMFTACFIRHCALQGINKEV